MFINLLITSSLVLQLDLIIIANGERTKDQMYEYFSGRPSCFRRMNATHQTGCSSKRDGSTGVIHFVEEKTDLDFILKSGNASSYIPIIPTHLFERDTLKALKKSKKITGVILYRNNASVPTNYSHEDVCPNQASNIEGTCSMAWNKQGTGILHEDIPFPMYFVDNDDNLLKMKDCFGKFNNYSYESQNVRSLCAIELDTFMYATTDTPTCIRRSNSKTNLNPVKFCDPLGGENIWASLFPVENSTSNANKYIIISARLDTTSLFDGTFPGATSPVTGLVTLLGTADLLKRMVRNEKLQDVNVLFILFNGETYDYIGSQRLVYDMEKDEFPMKIDPNIKHPMSQIRLEDISLFIELSQLSFSNAVFVHMSENKPEIKDFYEKLKNNTHLSLRQMGIPLPPSSLQSFLRARPTIPGVILADHGHEYLNKYYNSIYDNVDNIDYNYNDTDVKDNSIQYHTANITEMVARSVFQEIMQKSYKGDEKPRLDLINELYNCYLLNSNCLVHQVVQRKDLRQAISNSYGFYVGVPVAPNMLTYIIGLTLGWVIGDVVNKTCVADPETPMYNYFNMSISLDDVNTTVCYRTTMNFTEALSPAFLIDDYDWKSGRYSSWTESTWKELSVRMFLKPSSAHERYTLAIGSITLVMSLIVVYFIKSRSHILFATPEDCSPTNC